MTYVNIIVVDYSSLKDDKTMCVLRMRDNVLSSDEVTKVSDELYSSFIEKTGRVR